MLERLERSRLSMRFRNAPESILAATKHWQFPHPVIEVSAILRRMHPEGSTYLATTICQKSYVMKVAGRDGCALNLFSEAFGAALGVYLSLPFPLWNPLIVDTGTIRSEQSTSPRSRHLDCLPNGLYFGSKVRSTDSVLMEYLPASLLITDRVALQMARIRVFDTWIALNGPRSYLAYRDSKTGEVDVEFIGNSRMLDHSLDDSRSELPLQNPFLHARNSEALTRAVDILVDAIISIKRDTLELLLDVAPPSWSTRRERKLVADVLCQRSAKMAAQKALWKAQATDTTRILGTCDIV